MEPIILIRQIRDALDELEALLLGTEIGKGEIGTTISRKTISSKDVPEKVVLYTDGGLREDHGYGSYHFENVYETVEFESQTGNESEYKALLAGVEAVLAAGGAQTLLIKTDSQLMVRQLDGRYAVKAPHLRKLWREAKTLLAGFPSWKIGHIPKREIELVLGH